MSDDAIYLVSYDEKWPVLAATEIAAIHAAIPNLNFEIEHIGSTAVPGLSAKPILDLLIGVDSLAVAKKFIEPLEKMGYSYWRDNPKDSHFYFVKGLPLAGGSGRTHHVHIYEKNHEDFRKKRLFRDYLRSHPQSAQDYLHLKTNLSRQFPDDREAYTDGKTNFVNSILEKMRSKPIELESPRLILRRWNESDREPFYQMNSDPDVMRFLPKPLSREESDAMIVRMEEHFERNGFSWWALEKKETREFIGFAGLVIPTFEAHFTPCVEIGWRLAKAHWKNGYATEAAKAALEFGFSKIGLQEIVSLTVPANLPSIAVMERLGMRRNPSDDFDHPKLPLGHELRRHVLYRLRRSNYV